MTASLRAELIRLGRWPTTWVLLGLWLLLDIVFGYLFPYLSLDGDTGIAFGGGPDGGAAAMLAEILPQGVPVTMVQGMPMFGGALMLILGALAVGSGYGWGTWKTIFTIGPRRTTVMAATLTTLGLIVSVVTLVTLGVDVLAALVVAGLKDQAVTWPGLGEVARAAGSFLLIATMWTMAGVLVGTLTRSPALAVGLGLVWSLVVENLLRGVGALLGPVEALTKGLPGTAAGSLAGALGASTPGDPNGTPGVLTVLGGGTAVAVLCVYVLAFVAATVAITARRDVAG